MNKQSQRLFVRHRARLAVLLLPLVLLSLAGCSSSTMSLITAPTSVPIVTPTMEPTQVPQVVSTGFDRYAGNCPDAATEDVALIAYAQSQNYNFDMQLHIAPTGGCDEEATTAAYHSFVTQVGQATLSMNAIDTQWVYGYAPTREAFIESVFAKLQAHYPSLSKVQINVMYAGQIRATLTYGGHGQPVYQSY